MADKGVNTQELLSEPKPEGLQSIFSPGMKYESMNTIRTANLIRSTTRKLPIRKMTYSQIDTSVKKHP